MDQANLALAQPHKPHPVTAPGTGPSPRDLPIADRCQNPHLTPASSPGPAGKRPGGPAGGRSAPDALAGVDPPPAAGGRAGLPELHQPADRRPAGDLTANGQGPPAQPAPPLRTARQG